MKHLILITFLILTHLSKGQVINSANFQSKIEGIWTLHACDENWKMVYWKCVDTLTIDSKGLEKSVRTCEKPLDFPNDEVFDPIILGQRIWTKYDDKKKLLYYRNYEEWDNSWSDVLGEYRVVSFTEDEIRMECDGYDEGAPTVYTIRMLYRRVK